METADGTAGAELSIGSGPFEEGLFPVCMPNGNAARAHVTGACDGGHKRQAEDIQRTRQAIGLPGTPDKKAPSPKRKLEPRTEGGIQPPVPTGNLPVYAITILAPASSVRSADARLTIARAILAPPTDEGSMGLA